MKIYWVNDRTKPIVITFNTLSNIIAQIEKQQSTWIEIPDPPKGKSLFIKEWDYNTVFISHISNKSIPTSPKEKT